MTIKHKFKFERVADGYNNVMALQIHRCNQLGSPDEWQQYILDPDELEELRRVLDIGMGDCDHCSAWKLYFDGMVEETMEEREAKIKAKENRQNIISHDMRRFAKLELWLEGLSDSINAVQTMHTAGLNECRNEIAHIKEDLSGHAGKHMKDNLVEKVHNLELFREQIIQYNARDFNTVNAKYFELQGKLIDTMKRNEWRFDHLEDETLINNDGYHALAKCIDDLKVDLERLKTDMAVMKFALTTHMGMSHEQDK